MADEKVQMSTEQAMLRRLWMRAERLGRLVEMDAPKTIVVQDAWLVFEAAMALDPEEMGKRLAERMAQDIRRRAHRCTNLACQDGEISHEQTELPLCPTCTNQHEVDMAVAEKEFDEPEEH